jgi:putative aminopeptidase FrvX
MPGKDGSGIIGHWDEIGAIVRHLRSQRALLEGKWHEHFGN